MRFYYFHVNAEHRVNWESSGKYFNVLLKYKIKKFIEKRKWQDYKKWSNNSQRRDLIDLTTVEFYNVWDE